MAIFNKIENYMILLIKKSYYKIYRDKHDETVLRKTLKDIIDWQTKNEGKRKS